MSLEAKLKHRLEELNTHIIDKNLFGQKDTLIAVISWIDLYNAKFKPTYDDAITFLERYLIPNLNYIKVLDFAQIMPYKDMEHRYDNAFRIEVSKKRTEGSIWNKKHYGMKISLNLKDTLS